MYWKKSVVYIYIGLVLSRVSGIYCGVLEYTPHGQSVGGNYCIGENTFVEEN